MSDSIWKTPDQKPDKNCPIVFRNDIGVIYCALDPKSAFLMRSDHKWAYLHEVVNQADKAERLQKAVDLAIQRLEQGKQKFGKSRTGPNKETAMLCEIVIDEIKQLIKENQ